MKRNNVLSQAVLYALASTGYNGLAYAQESETEGEEDPSILESLTVTATRTGEERDVQQTAMAVDAMNDKALREQHVGNFDDLVKYNPKISFGGRGPGQASVFLRGMAVQPITVLLSAAQGTAPNVAVYMDEQPVTAPGRNLDIYVTDLERVEVLPGPQGTLFGASSQAGTIRYITKKPTPYAFETGVSTSFASTKHGDPSQSVEGFMNFPVTDRISARVAFYNVHLGGYIDNVAGEFSVDPAQNPLSAVNLPGASYQNATNADIAQEDFNDSQYRGFRASGSIDFDNGWSLLVQNAYQEMSADGVFDYDPAVGDLQVQRFFPDWLDDTFNQLTWTLEGRLGALEMIYTGGYLDRDVQQSVDYTGYNNAGAFIAYYTCTYDNPAYIVNYGADPNAITPGGRECLDPTKGTRIDQQHSRLTNELRVMTDQSQPLRFIGGVFWDDLEIETQDDYHYFAGMAPGALGFAPNLPIQTARNINQNVRPATVAFFNDITRTDVSKAVFGEVSYDLTEKLTGTVGFRYYDIELDFYGSSNFASGVFSGSTDQQAGRDYDVSGGHTPQPRSEDGVVPKLTMSYQYTPNVMFYGTYSEGFRPGGWNRGGGIPSANPAFPTVSASYETDEVKNLEFGWKTMLLGNRLRLNGNIYMIDWTDMQISRFDPQNVSILTFIENGADSEIRGLETDLTWRASDNLTLYGSVSLNDTELTSTSAQAIELAPVGSELPLVPDLQAAFRARYEYNIAGDWADWGYFQGAVQYASDSWSSLVAVERQKQDGYAVLDLTTGFTKGDWNIGLFINNVTDERAELFKNNQDDINRITTNRPRTIGVRLTYAPLGQ